MLALASTFAAATARADEVDDFAGALRPYLTDEFELAAGRFQAILVQHTLTSPDLIAAARRYYAATLVFLNRQSDARAVIEQLLRESPDAQIDPTQFDPRIVQLFERVRQDLAAELRSIREQRRAQRATEAAGQAERQRRVVELLTHERVVLRVPRWQMFMPLGIGQFAGGNDGLGVLFATTQIAGLVMGPVTALIAEAVFPPLAFGATYGEGARPLLELLTGLNVAGYTLFATSLVVGVLHANLSYRGERSETRIRPLPPELGNFRLGTLPLVGGGVLVSAAWRF